MPAAAATAIAILGKMGGLADFDLDFLGGLRKG